MSSPAEEWRCGCPILPRPGIVGGRRCPPGLDERVAFETAFETLAVVFAFTPKLSGGAELEEAPPDVVPGCNPRCCVAGLEKKFMIVCFCLFLLKREDVL